MPTPEYLTQLRNNIARGFNVREIQDLCFEMGINSEEVINASAVLSEIARELVLYLDRRQKLDLLARKCSELRPHLLWIDTQSPLGVDEAKALQQSPNGLLTKDQSQGVTASQSVDEMLQDKVFPQGISETVYLVHSSQVIRERTDTELGEYVVRVWLEAYNKTDFEQVEQVTYRLHETFQRQVISTAAATNSFILTLQVWGEFTVIAYVKRKNEPPLWVTRYLDLPGRPPDPPE